MSKKRILIVDDEQDLVFGLKMHLEKNDFEVLTAKDGQEGLDKVRREKPDVIVLDLMLPKLDGYKVCRMLKFDEKYKHVPVIMLTARVQKNDEKLGYEVGADAYMTKPYDAQELVKKIRKLLKEEQ